MDRQRLAEALAYEQQRRSRFANVIPTAQPGDPEVIPEQGVRSRLENLSSGLGQGGVNTLEGLRQLVTSPIETGRAMVEGGVEMIRDPALIAEALRETGRRAASGPLGLGEVIGESLNPMRVRSRPVMQEIDVYHGSPHRFEEFDASKIGTGEGAQAYGHGIYLAENPDVAKSYRFKRLTGDIAFDDGTKINVLNLPKESLEKVAAQIWLLSPSYKEASTYVLGRDRKQWQKEHPEWENAQEQVLNEIKKLDQKGAKLGGGSVYTADLPDEMVDRMLDWDKPLSQQSPAVQKAVKQLMDSEMWDADTRKLIGDADIKGSKFYEAVASLDELAGRGPFGQAASEELARLGIPGIKYADAGSRGQGGSGTRNFVVFPGEEKKVKILKRE